MQDLIQSWHTLERAGLLVPVALASVALLTAGLVAFAVERQLRAQRKAQEARLTESSASFQLLFDSNPLPMWVFESSSLRILAVNDATLSTYGYTRAQFETMTLFDLRSPEHHEALRKVVSQPRGAIEGRIGRHKRANGEEFDVAIYSRFVNEGPQARVLVAAIDVSAQRAAEADLRKARAFLNTIFDHVPVSVFVKEMSSGRYVLVNQTAEKLLGLTRDEIIGRKPSDFQLGEEANKARQCAIARLQSGEKITVSEHPIHTPKGEVRQVTIKRVVVSDVDGKPDYLVTVVDDHTDLDAARERIDFLRRHDSLTRLRNRNAFAEDLDAILKAAEGKPVILVAIDIGNFTLVNDVGGPAAGDDILKAIAAYLTADEDIALVGRVGGDEFMVVFNHGRADAAAEFAHQLSDVVRRFGAAFREGIALGTHIGIAIHPADGLDAVTFMANAEAAQHRARQLPAQHVCFFEAETDKRLRDRRILYRELDRALRQGEFLPYYQPQAWIDGTIYGFEALLRWQHPDRGMVYPGDFICAAEESGQIIEIGEFMLRQVCTDAMTWPTPLQVAVNLSPAQFDQADLPGRIAEILAETGMPASRLELEITESMLIGDSRRALRILHELKDMGIRIAMDDFGTGYSSLAYLQAFPFDRLKIDRQFISGLETSRQSVAIVKAVIGLGHGLGLPVLAEGVETQEQLALLRAFGCNEVQGYLIGRPQPLSLDSPLLQGADMQALRRVG